MEPEILLMKIDAGFETTTKFMTRLDAIGMIEGFRGGGTTVYPIAHGIRVLLKGSQSQPKTYWDVLDYAAIAPNFVSTVEDENV